MEWLKEFLKEIENGEELEKKIAEKIKESYVSKGEYDAILTVKDDLQEQMKQRDKDIAELKKTAGDNTQLQQKYHDLEQKYKTDPQNLEKKYAESRKHSAVDMAILQAKGKNTKSAQPKFFRMPLYSWCNKSYFLHSPQNARKRGSPFHKQLWNNLPVEYISLL